MFVRVFCRSPDFILLMKTEIGLKQSKNVRKNFIPSFLYVLENPHKKEGTKRLDSLWAQTTFVGLKQWPDAAQEQHYDNERERSQSTTKLSHLRCEKIISERKMVSRHVPINHSFSFCTATFISTQRLSASMFMPHRTHCANNSKKSQLRCWNRIKSVFLLENLLTTFN